MVNSKILTDRQTDSTAQLKAQVARKYGHRKR